MIKKSKTEIENEIKQELNKRKDYAKQKASENKKYAYANTNAYKYLCACQELICEIGKAKATNKDVTELNKEYNKNHELFKKELAKVNFTTADLKPQYECSHCNDSGITKDKKFCSCFKKLLSQKLLENSGLNIKKLPSFKDVNYSIFDKNNIDNVKSIYDFAEKYAKSEVHTKTLLTICGQVGVGKTYLAECMLNSFLTREKFVLFLTAFELNELFLEYHLSPVDKKQIVLDSILNADVLVIDDLGVENILKNVTIENLYMLISMRQKSEKITIITTNLNPSEISTRYDERIFSRICDKQNCILINFLGDDLRLKKNN